MKPVRSRAFAAVVIVLVAAYLEIIGFWISHFPVLRAQFASISVALTLCIVLEHVSPRDPVSWKDRLPGLLFIFGLPLASALLAYPLAKLWFALGIPPLFEARGLPAWGAIALLIIARDFCNYWMHRFDHKVLWPIHSVHHSQTHLHAANGFAHPLQFVSELALITIPLSFVDLGSGMPLIVGLIIAFQAMVIHSPLRVHLGPLRYVIVDSRFHRIHHSIETRHFERNFGTIFSVWDQMFRTAYFPAAEEWPAVGVEGLDPPSSLREFLLYPIKVSRLTRKTEFQSSPSPEV